MSPKVFKGDQNAVVPSAIFNTSLILDFKMSEKCFEGDQDTVVPASFDI